MKKILASCFIFISLATQGYAQSTEGSGLVPVLSKFEAKFYGYIKVDAIYDDSAIVTGNVAQYVKSEVDSQSDNQFNLTMNQTRLGFSLKAPPAGQATVSGLVEMDFYGGGGENTPNPRLYKGYVEVRWPNFLILAGQDWDTFSTLYPTCLNFAYFGYAGNLQYRRPQFRAVQWLPVNDRSKFSVAAAVARTIGENIAVDKKNSGDDAGFPTVEYRAAYENKLTDGPPLILAFSGHYGKEEVDWITPGWGQRFGSWSLNGELLIPFGKSLYLKGEYFYGSNLDAYYGGIGQGINAVTHKAVAATGGWGEITILPVERLAFHFAAGVDHPFRRDLNDGDRSQNMAYFGNVYYDILSYLTAAFEYSYWRTTYKNAPRGDDNRFHTALIFTF